MKVSTKMLLAALACVSVAGTAMSQNLAEAATKEKERRAKAKRGKTYTENELRSAGQGFSPEATAEASADGAPADGSKPAGAPAATAEDQSAKKQKDWSDRFQKTEAEHRQWTEESTRIQNQLNSNADFYGAGRTGAMQALAEAKAKVAELQQKLADLEDEGRRAHYKR